MPSTRLDILKSMVEQNPTDSFARYGLAMEYRNTGDLDAAMGEFRALMAANPDFVPIALPVSREHLLREGLSPPFVEYMNNWPGFVAKEETVEA